MKLWSAAIAMLVLGMVIGYGFLYLTASVSESEDVREGAEDSAGRKVAYWVAPMDPNYRRDKPGKSPMGMDLVPVYADEQKRAAGDVVIDPSVVQNLGVRTTKVKYGPIDRRIDTVGYVEYDENALQHIHTRVDGWVEKLSVKAEGDPVSQGETLFELYSRTLVNAQQEYLLAKAAGQTILSSAAVERLGALGMTTPELADLDRTQEVKERVKVVASIKGVIAMLGVREGVYVTPSTHVMSIADLERVWILAEVMERHADAVSIGQRVVFEVDAKPGRQFEGEVEYVYPDLNPVTRSLKVRVAYSAVGEVFRPHMFARVSLFVSSEEDVHSVPTSAVIRGGVADRVVLALGDGRFQSAAVRVGYEAGERTVILDGVQATDEVVVSGQFLIDSESNIDSSLTRLEPHSEDG